MPPEETRFLPFLKRNMLDYGSTSSFEIEVQTLSASVVTFLLNGITKDSNFLFKRTSDGLGSVETFTFKVSDIPILLTCSTKATAVSSGMLWVIIFLKINGQRIYRLAQGYVTSTTAVGFPKSQDDDPVPGIGHIAKITGDDPSAGQEFIETVPDGEIWKLLGINVSYLTDANAGDRFPHLHIQDAASSNVMIFHSSIAHPASTNRSYTFAAVGGPVSLEQATDILVPISPEIWLDAGWKIRTFTTGDKAGDNWGAPSLYRIRYLRPGV